MLDKEYWDSLVKKNDWTIGTLKTYYEKVLALSAQFTTSNLKFKSTYDDLDEKNKKKFADFEVRRERFSNQINTLIMYLSWMYRVIDPKVKRNGAPHKQDTDEIKNTNKLANIRKVFRLMPTVTSSEAKLIDLCNQIEQELKDSKSKTANQQDKEKIKDESRRQTNTQNQKKSETTILDPSGYFYRQV